MAFKVIPTEIRGLLILEPQVFGDHRGFFFESYQLSAFQKIGIPDAFVQDNHSRSGKGVLRGLHYQIPGGAQGKLLRVIRGAVYDVAVDIRRNSPWFGEHFATELSAQNKRIFWIPPGFAHGFLTLEEDTEVLYKTTAEYAPALERGIRWDDPALAIPWPLTDEGLILSPRDQSLPLLQNAEMHFEYTP